MNKVRPCRYGNMIYPANDQYIGRSLDLYGEFSEGEAVLFRELVRPGDVVLDIGANLGTHTVPLAQWVGAQGRVLAFEPQRLPYYCLCGNVAQNNLYNVVCYQAGVGAAAGSLQVPELDYTATANFGGLELGRQYANCRTYPVSVVRVDDLGLPRCRLLKIDVEGMEREVLQGATATIAAQQPLLYVEDDRQEKSPALRSFLAALGYEMYLHRPRLYNPNNFRNNSENVFDDIISLNLFCHPRTSPCPLRPQEHGLERVVMPTSFNNVIYTA